MNTTRLIECVPNFSEGRDRAVIKQITDAIESVEGVRLLDVDPGEATNRTVVTFVGDPESVQEAAFRGVRKAAELIDMSRHHGAHPRMGATDVCPLIPVSGVTLEEAAEMARNLGRRIADELNIPVYAYEASALKSGRKNLAVCRRGEYEGLAERFGGEDGPDFGNRRGTMLPPGRVRLLSVPAISLSPSIITSTQLQRGAPTLSLSTCAKKGVRSVRA